MRHLQLYRTYPILCHFDSPTASGSSNSRRTSFRQFYSAADERSFLARKGGHSRAKRPSKGFTRTQVVTISSELLFFPSFVFLKCCISSWRSWVQVTFGFFKCQMNHPRRQIGNCQKFLVENQSTSLDLLLEEKNTCVRVSMC